MSSKPHAQRQSRKGAWIAIGILVLALVAGVTFIFSGIYNVAADDPHTRPVYWLLETARDRSVAAHARNVPPPPDLADPARIAAGAGLYAEMCAACHLAPGMERTEIAQGLYPAAPELARGNDLTPAEKFWVIKHGIKSTGMAAWGKTHNDTLIWNMVAFLQKLPGLSADQYQTLVKAAPEGHDEMMKEQDGGQDPAASDHHDDDMGHPH
ncbi:MAG: cytochrome C [Novosphingobium sp.]|uniref:Cytochrome c n=1 Tax=Tsuneonella suprasediminis TaxID=2306996 RepID=A0A419R5M3_9SPHN|nr:MULTISPECIES: cytochrome c [Sphingomonadales]MAC58401.1 cytochrome C [Novosphingobium sp.]RJX70357.1 cytochrome c [Tsuneonella suprasediminis]